MNSIKTLLTVFFVFLFTIPSYSQITVISDGSEYEEKEIGQSKSLGIGMVAKLTERKYTDGDLVYFLLFRNSEYTSIVDFEAVSFFADEETLDQLYSLFKDGFDSPEVNRYKITIQLGDETFTIRGSGVGKIKYMTFYTKNDTSHPLTLKQVNQLFGR